MTNSFHAVQQQGQALEAVTQAVPVKNPDAKRWHFNALKHLELFLDCERLAEKHEREAGNIH